MGDSDDDELRDLRAARQARLGGAAPSSLVREQLTLVGQHVGSPRDSRPG